MKTKKLIPITECASCGKKFKISSPVTIVDKDTITHERCSIPYLIKKQENLPDEKKERIGRWDFDFRFTVDYEKSSKLISEQQYIEYKKMFSRVYLPTADVIVKVIVRDKIWEGASRNYLIDLQYIHALNKIWEKKKDTFRSGFKLSFIPSVLKMFRNKGYLSKKQWQLLKDLVDRNIDKADYAYFSNALINARDMSNIELPDRLRLAQRKQSFIKYYNAEHGIPEEEE